MRHALLVLGSLVLAGAALGCRTPAEQSRAAHAKFDPRVDELVVRTDKALAAEMPPYRAIADEHARWANYLARYAQKYRDPSFNASISRLYQRNAAIYDLLEEPATADKYRGLATQYDADSSTVVMPGAGDTDPTVAAAVGSPRSGAQDPGDVEPPMPARPEVRARVAVLPLDEPNATKDSYGYGEQYSGFLHMAFDRGRQFELIERGAIKQILAERNLAEMQEGDGARELGKLLQVDVLVVGHIGPNPDHSVFNVNVRLVSTATGKNVVSAADTIKDGNAGFAGSCKKVAAELTGLYSQRR